MKLDTCQSAGYNLIYLLELDIGSQKFTRERSLMGDRIGMVEGEIES